MQTSDKTARQLFAEVKANPTRKRFGFGRMPALIKPEEAATAILKGWEAGDFEIHFPKRFTLWLKLLRLLPYRLYFPLVRKFTGL